ncbi:bifunctional tetrahydrofolate synthase/dihydrofolate synthase [Halopseudomonas salina]|uniref:Dihydrofolate synthase/folylpolyglutamate synthase n=1 Tax=Halopseudomonas salina TaxID=1323744 RepID=A0ABQ1PZN2_9GAMM|nr:bifunctional tetrahydrofolate synthase/dihydrofolate synthase [Halopseudomonas salina]GGD08632.1 bifunctional folylpolyglutamate synthase/dihydrofolate synthase [Halopseudomonas salina]
MLAADLAGWLARLEKLHPTDIEMGLERVAEVARRTGIRQPGSRVFTITGTNGKGSTCAALDSLLRRSGLRTGVYTSPHLLTYNERVCVDGQPVSDHQLCDAFAAIDLARAEISLTYFEFGTLAAMYLFQLAELDAWVLEVGLGGRLDAVNIIDPDVAIVTSIGLDHQEYLGNTREAVGFEKAGILRTGKPLVCSETDLPQTFAAAVARLQVPVQQRGIGYGWESSDSGWSIWGVGPKLTPRRVNHLPPVHLPRDNLCSALQAFWAAGLDLPDNQIIEALDAARVPGRLEQRTISWHGQPRRLLLDVGHNPHAAGFLAQQLRARPLDRHAVFGLLADKDLAGVVHPLLGVFDGWAVAPLDSPRTRPNIELVTHLTALSERVEAFESVPAALEQVLENTPASTEIVIFGSFFCVSAAILWLDEQTREVSNG